VFVIIVMFGTDDSFVLYRDWGGVKNANVINTTLHTERTIHRTHKVRYIAHRMYSMFHIELPAHCTQNVQHIAHRTYSTLHTERTAHCTQNVPLPGAVEIRV
jgi:hypothetical protein